MDSLSVSLTTDGLELAGKLLLSLVERFDANQVATYGVTAIPLLASCVMQSKRNLSGLVVRKARKAHGSRKLIEGRINPEEPVVILDDSVSSGLSMTECCSILEQAGLRVEGGVCLVRFGWYGGFALMQERGYRMEAVYDIWDDFIYHMEGEPDPKPNPTKVFPELNWLHDTAREGLHPAVLARSVIEGYLRNSQIPRPPERLDRPYDVRGGTWVSVRSKQNVYVRHARDGFWHFPGEDSGSPGHEVVMAAAKTTAALPQGEEGLARLSESSIAVTFFSPLEACNVGDLDNDRYGIVVRSRERPGHIGGALPRMPGIRGSWEQFHHARRKNAKLISFEPWDLYRHDVVKVVEPGSAWQQTGVPRTTESCWQEDPGIAGQVAQRALELALDTIPGASKACESGGATLDHLALESLDSVYVSIYLSGKLRGCMGSAVSNLEVDIRNLIQLALTDERFPEHRGDLDSASIAVTTSFLYSPLTLGSFTPKEVMERVRLGEQALMVYQGKRVGLLLPFVAATNNLGAEAYALEVIDKAGITRPPYSWRRFDCVSWLATSDGRPVRLKGALPAYCPGPLPLEASIEKLAGLFGKYLARHQRDDGYLYFRYLPHQDVLHERIDLPRSAHAAWVLTRAGERLRDAKLQTAARKLVDRLLARVEEDDGFMWIAADGGSSSTVSEVSFVLLALTCGADSERESLRTAKQLSRSLWSRIDSHGHIATHRSPSSNSDPYQDYFPGQVLLALAAACRSGVGDRDSAKLDRAFSYYRHRFRHKRDFGQAPWQMQAFSQWWRVTQDPAHASYVFEIADWLVGFQQHNGGGFITDQQSDTPGYTTCLYLEGLGAATRLAEAIGDCCRAARYHTACEKGFQFVDQLVIQERDRSLLPNPNWAIGGVRCSFIRDEVRIDFVQHALSAVLELHPGASSDEGQSH